MITQTEHETGGKGAKRSKVGQPAQKKPFQKADNYTVRDRVEFCASLVAKGSSTHEIKSRLKAAPHNLSGRQAEEYLSRARAWLLQNASGRTRTQALADAIKFYDDVIADEKQSMRDRLAARNRLDQIFGLDAPKNVHVSGTEGGVIEMALSAEMSSALELVYGKQAVIDVTAETVKALPAAKQATGETPAPAPVRKIPLFGVKK